MNQESPDIDAIFCKAVGIANAEQRGAYVDSACGGNVELKQRVARLLQAHFDAGESFLEIPPDELQKTIEMPLIQEGLGTIIGHYKLLQQIGEGGFGVVYMAEQLEPVHRKVALKIIKPGMDTKEVVARFEAERQALALMDHPNIARVFDAGTTDSGRPFFVMELVRGIPITNYCDEANLAPRERLNLFITVCQAIQHAHQKGIIHRDIKPRNVLVTLHDGTPVVKVIDFGIAKAIDHRLTERTLFTQFGQMIGTPMYMSPEQAELSGLDVDTRTDIYSLGVLLYELITGTTPFDRQRLHEAAYDEVRRIIREEEPPAPSKKISTLGEALKVVSAHRQTDPKKLSAVVSGDLDWIVMKALEKERGRRYATAISFAADIERHLQDKPIDARPPSAIYRFRKFIRRNNSVIAVPALVLAALAVGVALTHFVFKSGGPTQETQLATLENHANQLASAGRYREAEEAYRKLLDLRGEWVGENAMDTIRTTDELAGILKQQNRLEDAAALYAQSWRKRRGSLGAEHPETQRSAAKAGWMYAEASIVLAGPSLDIPPIDLDRARQLGHLALNISPDAGGLCLGWIELRLGNFESARNYLTGLLQERECPPIAFIGLSKVELELGHRERARDWFLTYSSAPVVNPPQGMILLRNEMASALQIPYPMSDWGPQSIAALDRIIAEYGRCATLWTSRGETHALMNNWAEAGKDFMKASQLDPEYTHVWNVAAVYSLRANNVPAYRDSCRSALKSFLRKADPILAMRSTLAYGSDVAKVLVMACSLAPSAELDREKLLYIAEQAYSADSRNAEARFMALTAKAMALYRCGRFEQAIAAAPSTGTAGDMQFSLLFQAMAHHQLGDSKLASEKLKAVREELSKNLPLPNQYFHLKACLPVVLAEAEALIESTTPQRNVSGSASPTNAALAR